MVPQRTTNPDWPDKIRRLLSDLKLTQAGLAEQLGVSAATVSRWIQGNHEPTAKTYVALGNLAPKPDGVFFWERAGIDTSSLTDSGHREEISSARLNVDQFHLIASGELSRDLAIAKNVVAIPLLNITAYGDQMAPPENVRFSQAEVEEVLLAPLDWCPHPASMVSMHLSGDSMTPLISPGSLIFIDTAQTDRTTLNQKLAVFSHRDLGFKVARFQRLSGSDFLISANHRCLPVDVSNASKWKAFGEVLWWVSKDGDSAA